MNNEIINILKTALAEDLGTEGDITSAAIFDAGEWGEALIRCKQSGVLSGAALMAPLFELVDSYLADPSMISFMSGAERPHAPPTHAAVRTKVELFCADGDLMEVGAVICKIEGPVRSILAGERTALNLLQRLSGVATATRNMVNVLKGGNTRLLDTRKTAPGLRMLDKAAVRHGGGCSHRNGLYDMILIKDTHIKCAGGVKSALVKALAWRGGAAEPLIEIEVQSVAGFLEALALGPDRIMLDNMSPDEIEQCVEGRNASNKDIKLEASGNVSLSTLPALAATGVDFVSSGAITHSAAALDIHLVMV
jgi:nicotinate-nucleotide pyrophosphorylase (carboxylating)